MPGQLKLAVALDGAGWHPAAWREPAADPKALFTANYWAGLVLEAERGLLDFVTFEDSFGLPGNGLAEFHFLSVRMSHILLYIMV